MPPQTLRKPDVVRVAVPAPDDNGEKKLSLEEWQALRQDQHSLIADPKFADLAKWDFTLDGDSPAFALGFKETDRSDVGPRPHHGTLGSI
ncbi:MAG: hypothetical protein AUJ92_09985 [Armatimonadetes bacterium CG2_30_59_28]|nr:hypothetical protein [Armatimonadota bacterium]OIO94480.1 MAG: hypothetical protein AUJ92_09985 [Armatimonadetes bacterium CG2_30_59_28]PIU66229.1 MAG: hypothetical protein COS85_05645 [Armatimonadetes bacterium CG07_land_8_20_14_0_80_59_28]PIX40127.1 MAG: hypothetical protein COZ56_15520 [Armatimonadetes bacterium CG_4_8_14_3_um_filter_58_9]PIY41078.1 MAG: hypothetical protein COZ05_16290 [Armatimonadetes bacterium CG_4_10_14_3_um_filter_59_10]PJB64087.1 MAG: hypothetical protein CO095_152